MSFPSQTPQTPPQRSTLNEPPPLVNPFSQFDERALWKGFDFNDFHSPTPSFVLWNSPDTPSSSTFDPVNYSPTAQLDFERFTLADYNNQDTTSFRVNSRDDDNVGFFSNSIRYNDLFMPFQDNIVGLNPVINCRVDKGFIWANNSNKTVATTYRRNFFQISTSVVLQPNNRIQMNDEEIGNPLVMINGQYHPIDSFSVGISASMCDDCAVVEDPVHLIQFSTAREKGPKRCPSRLPLQALISNDSDDSEAQVAKFERIQFERSTHRKSEMFRLNVSLHAQLDNSAEVRIGEAKSMPIVVRGRSPGHYPDETYAGRTLPRARSTQVLRKKGKGGKSMRVSKSTPSFNSNSAARRMSSITLDSVASSASTNTNDSHDTPMSTAASIPDTQYTHDNLPGHADPTPAKPTLQDLAMACEMDMATL
ncbi:hypothetical protein E3P92_00365 [Wallemia ichthyophaga]|nr:hypothetical protein E3P92_00365 [Wallemia ichthyophaga]